MIQEYTKEMFQKDKEDMIVWLAANWTYDKEWSIYLGNILINLKNWINSLKV